MPENFPKVALVAAILSVLAAALLQSVTPALLAFAIVFATICIALLWLTASNAPSPEAAELSQTSLSLRPGFGRELLGNMPAPLLVIDGRGRITYANAAANALGVALVPGDHFATAFRVPVFVETVNTVLNSDAPGTCQFSLPGQDRILEARISPLPDGADLGASPQILAFLQDRTDEIQAARMRTDFIANASHELRTPLASVIGYIETLQGHAKDDPEAQERFLAIMARQAGRMNSLVEDLLSLSRIEMDARRKPTEVCDLYGILHETLAVLRPLASQNKTELIVDVPATGAPVLGDRNQLIQVTTNLIDNAVKYGRGNPVEITAPDRPNGQFAISVRDRGPGIAREHLGRLTERFYRVNVSESRKIGGTGLGLAIVKHILNRHGGGLDIESEPGKGSRFLAWFPGRSDAAETKSADS